MNVQAQPTIRVVQVQHLQPGDVLHKGGLKVVKVEQRSAMSARYRKVTFDNGLNCVWTATLTVGVLKEEKD